MEMLMLIVDSSVREELEIFLVKEGVEAYTEIPEVHGVGSTGPRMGSVAYPGTSSMILAMVEGELLPALCVRLEEYCAGCRERIHLAHWPITVLN